MKKNTQKTPTGGVIMIPIGGIRRPFRFTYKAIKKFLKETGGSLSSLGENMSPENIEAMIFFGLMEGYRKKEIQPDFSRSEIEDWIDEDFTAIERTTAAIEQFFPSQTNNDTGSEKKN